MTDRVAGPGPVAGVRGGHVLAVLCMVGVTMLWSSAGVVSRQLVAADGFQTTFWRSLFAGLALLAWLAWSAQRNRRSLASVFRGGGSALWISGACWATMFTCFMLALSLATVANVLVTLSLGPLFTALLGWRMFGHRLPARTWCAVAAAGVGIAWMYGHALGTDPKQLLGTLVALGVPIAAAINWTLLQRRGAEVDLVPALVIGAAISALLMLPFAWPLAIPANDLALLAGLGAFQLALPCVLAVMLARKLPAAEMALLSLLEVVFGIAATWIWGGERPGLPVLTGGGLVIAALAINQALALRDQPA